MAKEKDEAKIIAATSVSEAEFFEWARRDQADKIKAALQKDPRLALAVRDSDGDTALINSAGFGSIEALKALIPASDLNARGGGGHTALMRAAEQGHAEAVRLLIPGTWPDAVADEGHPALGLALLWGNLECAEALIPVSDPRLQWSAGGEIVDAEEAARRRGAALLADLIAERKRVLNEREELASVLPGAARSSSPRM